MKLVRGSCLRVARLAVAIAVVPAVPAVAETFSPAHHDCSGATAHIQEIACGSAITDELTSAGSCRVEADNTYLDVYSFSGNAGQQVTITSTGAFDTRLSLCYSISCLVSGGERGGPTGSQIVFTLPWSGTWVILVRAWEPNTFGAYTLTLQCSGGGGECQTSPTTLCLHGGRYLVQAVFTTPQGQPTPAMAAPLTSDAGMFWFFSANNIEALVKVVDGCAFNQHHWVFAAGLTNVEVLLLVIDTRTGTTWSYYNPQGRPFASILDTAAFATCS